jgi:hypothetical protein
MSEALALSPLDSDRFGIVVARADGVTPDAVPAVLSFCQANDVELVIARCDGADQAAARELARAGLVLLEAQITYRGPLTGSTVAPGIREAVAQDADGMADLARGGFDDYAGHYHADPRLPPDACRDVYVDWTLRGLAGEAADMVFVVEIEDRLAAFGLFTHAGDEIAFQLSAVAPWARGLRLYRGILARGMAWGRSVGARSVVGVVAHGTTAAHRNLIASGMRPVGSTSTFHGWRDRLLFA